MHTKFLSENLKGREHTEDLGIDGKIILEWTIRCRLDSFCSFEHSNESLVP